ncbi:MAG TPA: ABC transporter substrate-binding protein [Solirubrobacteraceae bacterium]
MKYPSPVRRAALGGTLAIALALIASACGQKHDVISPTGVKRFTVALDFFPNADHAALYDAISGGYFRAGGLDVAPQTPANPAEPLQLLASGKVDMAISYEPELLLARDQGLKLVSIGALVQRPLTSIIALAGQHITTASELAGKTVGTAGINYQTAELTTILAHAGVKRSSVKEVNVGFNLIPAMLSGKVAATLGGFWNYEALQLQLMGKHPVVIPVDEAGVPTYNELVLVVRKDEAQHDGQDLRAFLAALTHGETAVKANPKAAAQAILKANPSLEGKLQLQSIQASLAAAYPAKASEPYGYQDPSAWASFSRWMFAHGLLRNNPAALSQPFTNEFLPGQGL